jgi:excisionase family DNA binding protein
VSQARKRPASPITFADRPVVNLQEAAELLDLSWRTMLRRVQAGEIRGLRVGHQWRIRRAEIDRYLAEQELIQNPPRRKATAS